MGNYQSKRASTQLGGSSAAYIEALYEQYLDAPESVSAEWRTYFDGIRAGASDETPRLPVQERFEAMADLPDLPGGEADPEAIAKQVAVLGLISGYRTRGHQAADLCPIHLRPRREVPDIDYRWHGLTDADLDRTFNTGTLFSGDMKLRDIIAYLDKAYKHHIGAEISHIHNTEERRWLQERLERAAKGYGYSDEQKRIFLQQLVAADGLEKYLHKRFVGQKRFSLEGGDGLIPLTDVLIRKLGAAGSKEIGIAMAHRGRLNMLINILGKRPADLFDEFEGKYTPQGGRSGDVKYHMGFSSSIETAGGLVDLTLAYNPSHLEFVNPVMQGSMRARIERVRADDPNYAVPIQIHGDAAFAGQGVNLETLQLSQVRGYRVGGTLHIIVNNQIGFTTGSASARSTTYATDLAKGLQVPIFHVNADDPETVARAALRAYEYRAAFHKDVIIDLICYRRRGHNEGDDPSMTQPVMYRLIDSLPSTRAVYTADLVGRGDITAEDARRIERDSRDELERIFAETRAAHARAARAHADPPPSNDTIDATDPTKVGLQTTGLEVPASQRAGQGMMIGWTSAVSRRVVERIGDAQVAHPRGFTVHPKLEAMLAGRWRATREGGIDWGLGELIAIGSLLMEGVPVRLVGEDARRATFAQRHAVLHDHTSGQEWTPLSFLTPDQAPLEIYDSLLSEYAALAFEYGYSVERPEGLTMWEAQFGDFANGAQCVIDEYVTSATQKWGQRSGLVMLLPHGQEGQGPDHSSARIERYLLMCAQDNMRVAQPSTPANHFHLLREQAYSRPRRPLVVFTPKQLLRLRAATSAVEDFTSGVFRPVIGETDPAVASGAGVSRVLVCSGRVYYDLLAERAARKDFATAIVRLEQLYPLPLDELAGALAPFAGAEVRWVQDEAANQGVWPYLGLHLPESMTASGPVRLVSRPEAAAPAVGSVGMHRADQARLIARAFAPE